MYQPDKIEHLLQPDVKPVDEAGQLLLKAAQELREHGWCQRSMIDGSGRMCAHGAIAKAFYGNALSARTTQGPTEMTATSRVAHFLGPQHGVDTGIGCDGFSYGAFAGWNDAAGRTAEEVIAVLEGAARAT